MWKYDVCLPGVSLTIPEGSVKKGTTEEIFLAVSRDDKDRPKLTGKSEDYFISPAGSA